MLQLTVREALTIEGLQDVKVLAGSGGLDRNVTCVNVMEVPDILQWVRGGELLLTTTYPLKDSRISLRELIPLLNDKGLAAIAIKPHRYLEEIPQEILEIADELLFPVLELPLDVSFVDLINAVLTRILNYQAELLMRSEEIHRRFTGVVLDGGGLSEIAGLLSSILGKPVTILSTGGDLLATAGVQPDIPLPGENGYSGEGERIARALAGAEQRPVARSWQHGMLQRKVVQSSGSHVTVLQRPIKTGRIHYGEIVVWETGAPVKETDLVAVEHASTVAALAILKSRAVSEVELRFRNDFLNDLLSGNVRDREALLARAEIFGWQLHGPYAVIVALVRNSTHEPHEPRSDYQAVSPVLEAARRTGRLFYDTARRLDPGAITWSKTDSIVTLLPLPANADAREARRRAVWFATQVRQQIALDEEPEWTWGIGGFYSDLLDLHRAYSEARLAANNGRLVAGEGSLNHYDDMGVYRLLHQFQQPQHLEEFARQALQPVLDYDVRQNGRLLHTIETYLACERNLALTARELNLHYNTVKYRIQRADQLLAGGLHNPHRRLELELAIKALKLRGRSP